MTVGPTTQRRLQQAYQTLVGTGDMTEAENLSEELLARNPGMHPASVLAAQIDFLDRDYDAALDRLRPVASELPGYVGAWLLYGRVNEKLGDLVGALLSYSTIATQSGVASRRADELRARGAEVLAKRIGSDLEAGRVDDATRSLQRLQSIAPQDRLTLEATARVSRATTDYATELEAVRKLSILAPTDRRYQQRRADLEMEVGNASDGMRLMKELAAAHPDDLELEEKAARAEFLWRLQLLPPDVQSMATEIDLNRGDFATLVFWLFPEIRYGQSSGARIANDILEHPHRNEIVRVINLGLMDVESNTHHFGPYRAVQRIETLTAMTRLLSDQRPPPACVAAGPSTPDRSWQTICQQAFQCGLIPSQEDCLATLGMTGAEVVNLARKTQELSVDQ